VQFFRHLFLLILFFLPGRMEGQPLWRQHVPQAFVNIEKEINDSIRVLRQLSDTLRVQMNQIILSEGLDRISIVGENDMYLKEGMHKNFVGVPGRMQGHFERNMQIQLLENLHVDLYHADEQLYRWLDFSAVLRKHPNRTSFDRWTELWTAISPGERPVLAPAIISWLMDQLACDVVSDIRPSVAKNPFEKMQRFTPESDLPRSYTSQQEEWVFPIPAEKIAASFPMNGQFAFDNTEPLPETGYILLPESFRWKMRTSSFEYNSNFWARWITHTGEVKYTLAEWRDNGFFFNLPDTLLAGKVYKMDLIALPGGFSRSYANEKQCWAEMRETNTQTKSTTQASLLGEVLITTLYFRAGIQGFRARLNSMEGQIDYEKGTITYKSPDPFDAIEVFGTNTIKPFVTFGIDNYTVYDLQQAANSKELFYYLTVPVIEETDGISLDDQLIAEADHTAAAPFVRKTTLVDADKYISIPENRTENILIKNNYTAPAYFNHHVPDSFATNVPIPKITREHFLQKKKWPADSITCTIFLGEMQQLLRVVRLQQIQIKKRIAERAAFFYALDQRAAQREGKAFTATMDDYRKTEEENLPGVVRKVLNADVLSTLKNKFALQYNRHFPGTKQLCSSLNVNFY
jgi:hypothetical protein